MNVLFAKITRTILIIGWFKTKELSKIEGRKTFPPFYVLIP